MVEIETKRSDGSLGELIKGFGALDLDIPVDRLVMLKRYPKDHCVGLGHVESSGESLIRVSE